MAQRYWKYMVSEQGIDPHVRPGRQKLQATSIPPTHDINPANALQPIDKGPTHTAYSQA